VYQFNGTDWIQQGDTIAGGAKYDGFGAAVSLSADGNIVAGGAPYSDENGEYSGSVRVFRYNNKRRPTTNTDPLQNMQTPQQGGHWIPIGQTLVGQAAHLIGLEGHFPSMAMGIPLQLVHMMAKPIMSKYFISKMKNGNS